MVSEERVNHFDLGVKTKFPTGTTTLFWKTSALSLVSSRVRFFGVVLVKEVFHICVLRAPSLRQPFPSQRRLERVNSPCTVRGHEDDVMFECRTHSAALWTWNCRSSDLHDVAKEIAGFSPSR